MSDTEQATPAPAPAQPKEYVPLSRIDPAELAKAFEEDGIKMEEKSAPPVAETPKTEPAKEDGLPTLLRLAKERDTQRKLMEQKEIDAAKPYVEALKAIPPHTAQAIAKAIAAGDPVSLLAAAGMTHSQYNARLLGNIDREEKAPAKEEAPNDVAALKAEVEALRRDREAERIASSRNQMLGQMKSILKDDPKFKTINGLGDYEGVEGVLIRYHSQHGQLPGNTLEESVQLAAELYEYELRQHAEKFRPFLTAEQQSAVVTEKRAPESQPAAGTVTNRTLTNANTTAPAAPRTVPKTRQEILQALIEGREDSLD